MPCRSSADLLGLTQNQLTVLVDRNLIAWITLHTDLTHFLIQLVLHVVAYNLVAHVVDCCATVLRRGVSVTLLHAFLNLVTGITTTDRTCNGCDLLAVTTTDLITQLTAGYSTDDATHDLVLVLDRRLTGNGYVLANFAGSFDLLIDRLYSQYVSILRTTLDQAIGGNGTASSYYSST